MEPENEKNNMQGFGIIRQKLETFIRKFYINELIRGALLFIAIGLLYLIVTLLVEHFLWLGRGGRAVLFWLFLGVAVFLLYRFIIVPVFKLFRIQKGIGYKEASAIIGNHFPEIGDKLLNVLQLSTSNSKGAKERNELLVASIEQKSAELQPFPFHIAVDIRKNIHYAKYALIPVLIVLLVWISGNINWFSDSYNRVVHYSSAFEPPAPFQFFVVNNSLNGIEGKSFEIQVRTTGDVVPEDVEIHYGEETYFMQKDAPGNFSYIFKRPDQSVDFYLSANDVRSRPYRLEIVNAPAMTGFEMYLNYPDYLKMSSDTLTGTGNATIPEGTRITWRLKARNAEKVNWVSEDSVAVFKETTRNGNEAEFQWSARLYRDTEYEINTGNEDLPEYESLGFGIAVVKDEYPEIEVKEVSDSLSVSSTNFAGQVSDDNGFYGLKMVYYPEDREEEKSEKKIGINTSGNVDRFVTVFPDELSLEEGLNYTIYFEVTDNDALRRGKPVRSGLFTYRVRTGDEIEKEQLEQQRGAIRSLERSLGDMEEQRRELNDINTLNMEKEEKTFNDQQRIDNFLDRQRQQERTMQKFTKELSDHLKEVPGEEEDDAQKKLLEERLERQQEEIKKNEELLEELKEIADKIDREDMAKRLEKLSKSQQNNKRNLEQVLELTKRYYVNQKAGRLSKKLEKLGEEQEKISEEAGEKNTEKQEELNEEFEDFKKEAEELEEENEELKRPMELGRDEKKEKSVSEEQQKALENLKKENTENAKQQQKNAGQKMKQMAEEMKSAMQSGGASGDMEDAAVLRQILKNVVAFSFEQEDLMQVMNEMREDHPSFSENIKKQHQLKEAFEHIDDSLFALSLRRPELSEKVNKEITDGHFHIDKAIERLSENEVYRGVSSQQYAFTAANNLAALLGNILDNLQQSMGMGQGEGENEMQLPDIIQSQEELNQQMKDAMDGEKKKEGEGEKKEGEGKSEEGEEGQSEELFEIYKQQQMLRQILEKQMPDKPGQGNNGEKDSLLKEMEEVEDELLREGINESTLKKMLNLKHELLKLEDAAVEQGEENRRESRTNEQEYQGKQGDLNPELEEYLQGVEILNRQVLPLRQIYKEKVKEYFKKDD